jgi:hypothetical protein
MTGLKRALFATSAGLLITCLPVAPAAAGGPGLGIHPWGFGHGILGAVFGLATLPLAIISAVVSAGEPAAAAAAYPAAPGYYPPRPAYYPPMGYASAPRAYYAPRPYYAPRASYRAGNGYHESYRAGGNSYRRR